MPTFLENGLQVVDQELIDDVVRRIVERFQPKRIVLFGSHARGDAGPESDIDLFIEMESNLRPIDRMVAVGSLFAERLWGLDVFVYTPAEVEARRGRIGNLLSYVEAEGKLLYERRSG
jgi:predicted nucleotidyltransferase